MENETTHQAEWQANICSVFSSAKRIEILWALTSGERSVSEIAKAVDASLQNTSHHLRLMKDKGILTSRRAGRSIQYRISEPKTVNCLLFRQPAKDRL